MSSNFVFNRVFYEIMWKNTVQTDRPQVTIWRLRIACSIPKSTNTYSEYVILIVFPLQQSLQDRVSMLCYTYIVCLVCIYFLHQQYFYLYDVG